MTDMKGIALITGASSGLGAIYAALLAEAAREAMLPNLSRKDVAARYRPGRSTIRIRRQVNGRSALRASRARKPAAQYRESIRESC